MRAHPVPRFALTLIGFTAILGQIVLMRELIVVFCGNEISLGIILANWLLWTAVGSGLLGRLAERAHHPNRLMAGLQAVLAAVFPITILLVRASRSAFHLMPGEVLGPAAMLLISFAVLSGFCLISGLLFAVGSLTYARAAQASSAEAISSVYLLEALGSGVGGLLASLLLIRFLSAFEIAAILSFLNLAACASLAFYSRRLRQAVVVALITAVALVVFPSASRTLESLSRGWLWRGFQLLASRDSVYGNLAVVQSEGSRSLFENGLVFSTAPNVEAAEEAVHFALLEHPDPRSLLLIGGGTNGSLAQALQHPSLRRLDYVELDPAIFDLARTYFPAEWAPAERDPRVHTHPVDGRFFLKTTTDKFDVIILNLPDPQTAQLNRFYTLEFFREAAARLNPNGVFSFQLRSAEDYISPELAEFLRCISHTLTEVFPEVTYLPGESLHFFAAQRPGILAESPAEIISRLRARQIRTLYVREYYLPFRMSPDRMADLASQIRPRPATRINRDFAPIAYYFDVILWSKRFDSASARALRTLAAARFPLMMAVALLLPLPIVGWSALARRKHRRAESVAALSVAATGFTMMGLEVLLLLGFHALYGYIYQQLAVIMAAFMAGLALGSWRALGRKLKLENQNWKIEPLNSSSVKRQASIENPRRLAVLQIVIAFSPLNLFMVLLVFARTMGSLELTLGSYVGFPILALLSGVLGGYQFPVANRVYCGAGHTSSTTTASEPGALPGRSARGSGTLYALDLAGACLGAVLLSTYVIPVYGFLRTALFIAALNLVPAAFAWVSAGKIVDRPA